MVKISNIYLERVIKTMLILFVEKAKPIGAISQRKDGKYKKVAPDKWIKVTDGKGKETEEPEQSSKDILPDAKVELGYGGQEESFRISVSGGKLTGYLSDQDFPNQRSSPTRGELFYAEVEQESRRKGIALDLSKKALLMMKEKGTETVNLAPTSEEGRGFVKGLIDKGIISEPIQTSESGKAEHKILIGGKEEPEKEEPETVIKTFHYQIRCIESLKKRVRNNGKVPS